MVIFRQNQEYLNSMLGQKFFDYYFLQGGHLLLEMVGESAEHFLRQALGLFVARDKIY